MKKSSFLDTASLSNEMNLILFLLKEDKSKPAAPERLEVMDWNHFMELAVHHRVYPLLFSKIKDADFIPLHVLDFFSRWYKANTIQMLQLCAVMEHISRIFLDQGIPLLFLKGPAAAYELYGDVSLRTSSDLDFLIPINQLQQAEKLLSEEGYVKNDYIKTVLSDWKWRHHHVTYFHPEKRMKLEIHWRLHPGPSSEPGFEALWERKTACELIHSPVYQLSKEDLFSFLISHGARHGWSRLRWLADIQQLLKQDVHWNKAERIVRKCHYQRTAGQGLFLASQLLGARINKPMNRLADMESSKLLAQQAMFYLERQVNLHTNPVPEDVSSYHQRYLFALMSFRQKAFFLLSFLYPYPEDQQTLPLPSPFHFLYFPLRPFLWAWRRARKHVLSQGEK